VRPNYSVSKPALGVRLPIPAIKSKNWTSSVEAPLNGENDEVTRAKGLLESIMLGRFVDQVRNPRRRKSMPLPIPATNRAKSQFSRTSGGLPPQPWPFLSLGSTLVHWADPIQADEHQRYTGSSVLGLRSSPFCCHWS